MRTLLERLSRQRSFVRRLPASFDRLPIIVSPDSQLKYLKPGTAGFDRNLLEAAIQLVQTGDNVWDIGANVGVFTIASAARSRTGQIVAVEADIWLANLIRRTSRLPANAGFNIAVVPVAASSTAGVATFTIAARGRASNHLTNVPGNSQAGGVRETVDVATLPLDILLAHYPPPNVVKMDVEGAEVEVLKGMSQILEKVRPILYCEVNETNREQFLEILKAFEYTARNLHTKGGQAHIEFNMVYEPRERRFFGAGLAAS